MPKRSSYRKRKKKRKTFRQYAGIKESSVVSVLKKMGNHGVKTLLQKISDHKPLNNTEIKNVREIAKINGTTAQRMMRFFENAVTQSFPYKAFRWFPATQVTSWLIEALGKPLVQMDYDKDDGKEYLLDPILKKSSGFLKEKALQALNTKTDIGLKDFSKEAIIGAAATYLGKQLFNHLTNTTRSEL